MMDVFRETFCWLPLAHVLQGARRRVASGRAALCVPARHSGACLLRGRRQGDCGARRAVQQGRRHAGRHPSHRPVQVSELGTHAQSWLWLVVHAQARSGLRALWRAGSRPRRGSCVSCCGATPRPSRGGHPASVAWACALVSGRTPAPAEVGVGAVTRTCSTDGTCLGPRAGPDVTKAFLDQNNLELIVRSHEASVHACARVELLLPRWPR